jgi:hypothetical protein
MLVMANAGAPLERGAGGGFQGQDQFLQFESRSSMSHIISCGCRFILWFMG